VLLALLAVGVVEVSRSQHAGGGFLSEWIHASAPGPRQPPAEVDPESAASGRGATSPANAEPSVLTAGELSVMGEREQVPMVRYVDADGSVHMVRGMAGVPEAYRLDAVELGGGNVNLVSVPAPTAAAFRDWMPESNPNRSDVVLFSATWCGICRQAKRHLDRQGVVYQERDIDADPEAMRQVREVLGRVAVPLLDVNGRYIAGFRPDVYDRALGGA
jgi:glutaredoxin